MFLLIGLIITIIVIIIVVYYYYYNIIPSKEEDNNEEEEQKTSINEKNETDNDDKIKKIELSNDNSIGVGWNRGDNRFGSGYSRYSKDIATIPKGKYPSKNAIVAIMNKNLTSYNASNLGTLTFFLKDGKLHADVFRPKGKGNYSNDFIDDSRDHFYFSIDSELAEIFGLKPKRKKFYESYDNVKSITMGYFYTFGPMTYNREISEKVEL